VDQYVGGTGAFQPVEYTTGAEAPSGEYPLYLATGRTLYLSTSAASECFVEVSPQDAEQCQIKEGDAVKVISKRDEIEAKVRISDQVFSGTVFLPLQYTDTVINNLTFGSTDCEVSAVKIEKV
jgi:predicted molibdopterin-dependent oxidoreductase YjgC